MSGSLTERMADEEARASLASMPAAGLLHGAVNAQEQDFRWVRPLRFCDEQLRALGSCQAWHPGLFRQMGRTTAGICVVFETDAREVALEVRVDAEPRGTRSLLAEVDRGQVASGPHDGLSADVDHRHLYLGMPAASEQCVVIPLADGDPEDALGLQPLPGMGRTRRVRIWLPALRGCVVRDLVCDGTFIRPVARRKVLLALGDANTQGFVADDPAHSWPALLADRLDLELVNQGIAGQVFQPGSLFGLAGLVDVERICVSYGEGYRREPCLARRVSVDIRSYLSEVERLWSKAPVQVLTPLWHDEELWPPHPMSCHEQLGELIAAQVARHARMTLVDGHELLEHDVELYAAGAHPNERGCRQMATRLNAVIRIPGLRPSSVGKRRSRKKLPAPAEPAEENNTMALPLSDVSTM